MAFSQPLSIDIHAPSSTHLQNSIQEALSSRGWADATDSVMAEYVLVLLCNGKTRDQVDAELTELIGGDYDPAFTSWLWAEATRVTTNGEGSNQAIAGSSTARSPPARSSYSSPPRNRREADSYRPAESRYQPRSDDLRRSRSPVARRSQSPRPRDADEGFVPRPADHWQPPEQSRQNQRRNERRRPARELFQSAVSAAISNGSARAGALHSDAMDQGDDSPSTSTTGETASRPPAAPREMRIRGAAPVQAGNSGKELFANSSSSAPQTASLFSRAGIPDPHAQAFVPRGPAAMMKPAQNESPSLAARIDPMIPFNATSSLPDTNPATTSFPSKPTQTSLCRYSLACTNPLCDYSHPCPLAAVAKRKGEIKDDPILTSEGACRFGLQCSKVDCPFSHVSPAVYFISQKQGGAAMSAPAPSDPTQTPCRFADKCSNPSCAFAHYDAQGKIAPSPALTRLLAGEPDVKPPAPTILGGDESIEIDLNGSDSNPQLGPDGKPMALDRALDSQDSSNSSSTRHCKFGARCTRPDCYFTHPPGRKLQNGTAESSSNSRHISDRLSRFNRDGAEEDVERIIPVA